MGDELPMQGMVRLAYVVVVQYVVRVERGEPQDSLDPSGAPKSSKVPRFSILEMVSERGKRKDMRLE